MVSYNCECCLFCSKQKNDYNRHLKSKKHLRNTTDSLIPMVKSQKEPQKSQKEPQKSQKEPTFLCDFCESKFLTYASKRRHEIHRCKENTSIMTNKIKTLEKEKKKLEKKIEKMLDKTCTINNNTTNNNSNTIIVVNNYGKENTEYLTAEKIVQLLNRPYDSIQDLIKMLHFNADHPENHNVKITNKKEPFALVWNDPIWELRKKKTVIKDMVDKGYMMIDNSHDEVSHEFKENKKYLKFQNNFEDDASNIKELIEDETEIMIINETKKIDNS